MQKFVASSCNTVRSQQAFFFIQEKYGYSMHFSSKQNDGTKEYHKWHKLELKNDFKEHLTKYKRLPVESLAQKQKL